MSLENFNALSVPQAQSGLFELFNNQQWSSKVASQIPFADEESAIRVAEECFDELPSHAIVSALAQHTKITSPTENDVLLSEQQALRADGDKLSVLTEINEEYEKKFGFVYVVHAEGKSVAELRETAQERLKNDLATEFVNARSELKKIIIRRFVRWIHADASNLSLSTHVIDTTIGLPAAGIHIELLSSTGTVLSSGITNQDGRVVDFTNAHALRGSRFSLRFLVGSYFASQNRAAFYPEILINFHVSDPGRPYYIPLLLSPFGYSTYRGNQYDSD